ncbi:transposase [Streptomyces sp. NPDC056653]|uniref:transposase n=1 Tax=Streptomyces sp. NPDC056653 TaxID=3345894 RepID=UPI0036B84631
MRSGYALQLAFGPLDAVRPRSGEQIPSLTAQVARASNPGGTTAMWVRDRLDGLWCDQDFADGYPRDGRPGLSPAQLATVCVLQFLLDLSDRQVAEAVRFRIAAWLRPRGCDEAGPVATGSDVWRVTSECCDPRGRESTVLVGRQP